MRARKDYPSSQFGYQFIPRSEQTYQTFGPTYGLGSPAQRAARESAHYYGKGRYGFLKKAWKFSKPYLRKAAKAGLQEIGSRYLGSGIYTGQGSYDDNSNELVGSSNSDLIPRFSQSTDETGEITITHREYVGEVYSNEAGKSFENRSFPLNPGLEKTFPWLSQIAANFEEYDFQQLMFSYRSTVAEVSSSNGQVGTAILATNYNPSNRSFRDKGMMLEYSGASSAKTTDNIAHGVECDNEKLSGSHEKYVRTSALDPNQDIKEYDHGLFQLATANTPSAFQDNSIGELWVSYTVSLRKPKLFTGRGNAISRCILYASEATGLVPADNTIDDDHRRVFGEGDSVETQAPVYLTIASKSSFRPLITQSGTTDTTLVVLPGNLSGVFRVSLHWKGQAGLAANVSAAPPALVGNVLPHLGLYGGGQVIDGGATSEDDPSWYRRAGVYPGPTLRSQNISLEFTIKIEPASNNQNNGFLWGDMSDPLATNNGAVVHYTGQNASNTVNTDAFPFESGLATDGNVPVGAFDLHSVFMEIQEIGTNLEMGNNGTEVAKMESYRTGHVVDIIG